ncbi:MAG: patatin-like phospholipase family protein [Woeseiaceae bacterium]|nr:patatin-like phospholipase family protein [Woeseiaceae bacterium]
MKFPGFLLFLTLCLAVPLSPAAAEDTSTDRLRVGLVLGGGGARGAAHIGVLRELERLNVPVDAIVGTSMGAIVGGLYASGMSPDELEELVATLDWADALSDEPSREHLSFRRKQDDAQFPIDLDVGFRDGEFQLPQGVIIGHKLDLILRELTLDVSDVEDFDDLPVPFRAIASDLVRGEPHVMSSGDLATAIRASMSVPGVFAPVTRDGLLLADGGLTGNLGVNVIEAMDVDVIIAVDVEFPLYGEEDLDSSVAVYEQMLTILIRKETLRQIDRLSEDDFLIQPDLGTFASTDFPGSVATIEPGVSATRAQAERLSELSMSDAEYSAYLADRRGVEPVEGTVEFVRIVHDDELGSSVIDRRMPIEPGDAIDPKQLAAAADRLYGLDLFGSVGYRLVEEDGRTGVEFNARSKDWGPNFLQFGMSIEDDFEGSTAFNLTTRIRRPNINTLGAEWRTDLQLGTEPLLQTEFYQPFGSRWFIAPNVQAAQRNLNVFATDSTIARLRLTEGEFSLDAGAEIGTFGEFRVGLFRGAGEASVKVGDPSIVGFDFDAGGAFAALRFDTFDSSQFPTRGLQSELRWTLSRPGLGADSEFDTVEAGITGVWSRGKTSFALGADYATTLESDGAIQDFFPLGGFLRLSGFDRGEISGPHAALGRFVVYRRIGDSTGGLFEVPIYLGASVEAGNVWQSRDDLSFDTMITNGSLFFGLDTIAGPVFLAAGFAESGETNFYLFVGSTPR